MLTITETTFISVELANKACTHLFMALELTTESTTEPYTETDPFAYSTATTAVLWYTLMVFMGVMIDIGVLHKSIASYGQFQAL